MWKWVQPIITELNGEKKVGYILSFILIIILLIYSFISNNKTKKINKQIDYFKGLTIGEVIKYERVASTSRSTTFEYYVSGNRYTTSFYKRYRNCEKNGKCIGLKYVVEYSTIYPKHCRVLINVPIKGDTIPQNIADSLMQLSPFKENI